MNPTRTDRNQNHVPAPLRQTPSGIEQRLLTRARQRGLQPGAMLIVGFSGGRDSLMLAAALRRVEQVLHVRPVLVHVDHRLRPGSEGDAVRARELAECLGLEAVVRRLDEHPARVHPGVGVEEAARRERYRVLREEAIARVAAAMVTAHHQADQAETVLLHLLRGGGVHGASGMGEWTTISSACDSPPHDISPKKADQMALWRPFLSESRAAIDLEFSELGLEPIDDPSNADIALRRNALRHEVLPLLEKHAPGATAALARYAELAAEDDRALQELVAEFYPSAVDPGGYFRVEAARDRPLAVQRRLIREWLLRSTEIEMLSAERTAAILALLESGETGNVVEVGAGWRVRRVPGAIVVENTRDGRDDPERKMGER